MSSFDGIWREKKEEFLLPQAQVKSGGDFLPFNLPTEEELEKINLTPRPNIFQYLEETNLDKPQSKKIKKFSFAGLAVLLFGLIFTLSIQASRASERMDDLYADLGTRTDLTYKYLNDGDIRGALGETKTIKNDILELKKLVQSLGQDNKILQSVNRDSKISQKEILLNQIYELFVFMDQFEAQISALPNKLTSKTGQYVFDLGVFRSEILSLTNDLSDKITSFNTVVSQNSTLNFGDKLQNLNDGTKTASAIIDHDLFWLSGLDGKEKKILILFQNNGELRGGSGGSLGSFGVANFKDGKLASIDFGKNIYKLDHEYIKKEQIAPPEPLRFLLADDNAYAMKDSGWSVDGPDSLKTISDFYIKESGEEVDGVISIDTSFVEAILGETGSIAMPQYQLVVTKDNFRSEIEKETHDTYFTRPGALTENEPKKIISELMPKVMENFFASLADKNKNLQTLYIASDQFAQKHAILYMKNADFQKRIEEVNWAGKIYPAKSDYLYVNNSNVGGGKTSLSVEEKIKLDVAINADGTVANKLNIKRNFNKLSETDKANNQNFVRLMLPEKSSINKFETVSGNFERYMNQGLKDGSPFWQEGGFGKSIVNFWMSSQPGETSEASIEYSPGITFLTDSSFNYEILIQRQPGANADELEFVIHYPEGFHPVGVEDYDQENRQISLTKTIEKDTTIKIKFEKE